MRQVPQSVIWICFLTFVHSCPFGAKEHRTSSIFNLSIVMRLFYHFKFSLSTAKSAGRAALLCGHRFNLFCRLFCRTKNLPTKSRRFFNNNSGSCRFRPFVCLPNQRLFRFLSKLLSKHAHAEPCNCKRIGNAVADQEILFFVDLKERGCGQAFFECDLRFKYLCLGDPRI